jgi:hypothetical protein
MVKILILGHGGHGKDQFAEYISAINPHLSFTGSSKFACDLFIYKTLKSKYGYSSKEECYQDRRNHRDEWYKLIKDYNTPDPSLLAKQILKTHDGYIGMRSNEEYQACISQSLFDVIFWVNRSVVKPHEPESSFNIKFDPRVHILIPNNKDLKNLYRFAEMSVKVIKAV